MNKLSNEDITMIEEAVNNIKKEYDRIAKIADGKNGNVIFLALYRKEDVDTIVKCANIR